MHHIYIARCSDNTLYTGYTTDLKKREETHNAGKGAAYTRARLPVEFVYSETLETKSEAMKREWEIKQMKRSEKDKLINS